MVFDRCVRGYGLRIPVVMTTNNYYAARQKTSDDEYCFDIPGYGPDQVAIELIDNIIYISLAGETQKYFTVHKDVDLDKITSVVKNGQLIISMPKKQKQSRKIEVTSGEP
jgi:HSP20 family molecular chaperone IbpA